MKSLLKLLAFVVALFAAFTVYGQTDVIPVPTAADPVADVTSSFLVGFVQNHAWLSTVIAILGAFRLVAKPITTAIEIYVKNTPSTNDDAVLDRVQHSLPWKILFWLLDYTASIKVGSQAPQPAAAPAAPEAGK